MGVPRGFKTYVDKNGDYIFLDDVIADDDPEVIDDDKLSDDLKAVKEIAFAWNDKACDYVLCVKSKKK